MDQQTAQQTAERFINALHAIENGDQAGIDRIVDLFADDAQLSNPIIQRDGPPRAGREQIAAFWQNYRTTFKDIHSEFFDVTSSNRAAGLFWRSTGTHLTGSPIDYEGVSLLEFDDSGKIARFQGFFDSSKVVTKATT